MFVVELFEFFANFCFKFNNIFFHFVHLNYFLASNLNYKFVVFSMSSKTFFISDFSKKIKRPSEEL